MKIWIYLDFAGLVLGLGIIIMNLAGRVNISIGGGILVVVVASLSLLREIGELKRKVK